MGVPIVFIIISIAMFVFFCMTKRAGVEPMESLNDYLMAERKANFSRRKDIPEDYFLSIDGNLLPVKEYTKEQEVSREYSRVSNLQRDAVKAAGEKMIHMKEPLDNRQLKLQFGAANLEFIITYEENYNRFIHVMLEWAVALISIGDSESAQRVLETAIFYHCDRSQAYTLLADIYQAHADTQKLKELLQNEFLLNNPRAREKVLSCIGDCSSAD